MLAKTVPEPPPALTDFLLKGEATEGGMAFTLSGTVEIQGRNGGRLKVVSGQVAIGEVDGKARYNVSREGNAYFLDFKSKGTYPLNFQFQSKVTEVDSWKSTAFEIFSAPLRKVRIEKLPPDVQIDLPGASEPVKDEDAYESYLAPGGEFKLRWKGATPEKAGKLFYSAEGICEASAAAGLLRQKHLINLSVMQGELKVLKFALAGVGEVVRVEGKDILSWKITPALLPGDYRGLEVQLNQAQAKDYSLLVHTQAPLGVFPLEFEPMRLMPLEAVRYGGHLRVSNEGAVRLEVLSAMGVSQLSPELFPMDQRLVGSTKNIPQGESSQSFVYRFSGGDYTLKIQADNILPEITLSEIQAVHIGDSDTILQSELELDIREAPLREFNILIPSDYSVSSLEAANLGDYFVTAEEGQPGKSKLRLVFSTPLSGRQLLGLKLERNHSPKDEDWELPRVEPQDVKSVRGYIGVTAAEGLRLSATKANGLTEVATAFFPKKTAGLQLAYRIKDSNWKLNLNASKLDLTVQVDSLHLFSIGEGIAYGSSVMNFFIVGAPVSEFSFTAPESYGNVEFIGQEVRNWKREGNDYKVSLHTPQGGAYTLLATYDSRFNPHGEALDFSGLRPNGTQSEQGTLIVTSEHYYRQTSAEEEKLSPALVELEHDEIPAEYRLLYDAPILSSYQFTSRPFEATLKIKPYAESATLAQVIDYAELETKISTKGEVLTNHQYLLKSKGATHLEVKIPEGEKLWGASVNGKKVTPVSGKDATLFPLPQNADPNTLVTVDLKLARAETDTAELSISTPAVQAPVLLTDWSFASEPGHRLEYQGGNITPEVTQVKEPTGFTWLKEVVSFENGRRPFGYIAGAFLCGLAGILLIQIARKSNKTWREQPVPTLGFAAITLCGISLILSLRLADMVPGSEPSMEKADTGLQFRAPIQLSGAQLQVSIKNKEIEASGNFMAGTNSWPAVLSMVGLLAGLCMALAKGKRKILGNVLASTGWTGLLYWLMSQPGGAQHFPPLLATWLSLHILVPLAIHLYKIPRGIPIALPAQGSVAGTALLAFALVISPGEGDAKVKLFGASEESQQTAQPKAELPPQQPAPIPVVTEVDAVNHKVHVAKGRAMVAYSVEWDAKAGQNLLLATEPAVVTGGNWDKKQFKLRQVPIGGVRTYILECLRAEKENIMVDYQHPVTQEKETWQSVRLPGVSGVTNSITITIDAPDLLVECPEAVNLDTQEDKANGITTATATLMAAAGATFRWQPRSRDIRTEDTLYYAELDHLYTPTAGIIEGLHNIRIRPAQGQVRSLAVKVPGALTITDVTAEQMQGWRFDPDTRQLDLHFEPGHSQPFGFQVRSQVAAKPLPYDQTVAPLTLADAAGQVGLVGIATGAEVQLGNVKAELLSPINLEDFPNALVQSAQNGKQLVLRRSFRYSDNDANLQIEALPVQPDIRVSTQETLSIGEDRIVLATQLDVNITRAGIFKLTFDMPDGMDVETLSGPALSHWTELKTEKGRSLTLHLRGKTLGQTSFHASLAGPGIQGGEQLWDAPRLMIREANKQDGQLQVVPEQGMRLNVQNRDGLTQLDPKKVGILQKGVLVFRLLQNRWSLQFAIEKVEPWIQATVLQDVQVREGLHESQANITYTIENAGIKTLGFRLPEDAVGVRFRGNSVADAYKSEGGEPGQWEAKLTRRFIGKLEVHVTYQTLVPEDAEIQRPIQGIILDNINLQRGFLNLRTGSRLELQLAGTPPALKAVEWQTVPRELKRGIGDAGIRHTFRVLESAYELPLQVIRHEAEDVLPARILATDISSVLSEAGIMLTEVRIQIQPGNKRHLGMDLPKDAKFWSAFVNKKSVWPWEEGGKILIPMEAGTIGGASSEIKFLYTSKVGKMLTDKVENQLHGPKFDLPLEKINWFVHLPEHWEVKDTEGSTLELVETEEPRLAGFSIDSYLKREETLRQQQYEEAETMLNKSNDLLAQGEQRLARKALQTAWILSQADKDFNEDARVQLQNLKTQQALVGLANRRNFYYNDNLGQGDQSLAASNTPLPYLGQNQGKYTFQEARQILEKNTEEVNKGLEQLASCLIGHQDAALATPEAIRANLPRQGKVLNFTRSLKVDTDTGLQIQFKAERPGRKKDYQAFGILAAGFFMALCTMSVTQSKSA